MKYTWTEAPHVNARLIAPGGHLDGIVLRQHALVLGDPDVGALVVEGTKVRLAEFADSLHIVLLHDPHDDLAKAVADRVVNTADGLFDDPSDESARSLARRVAMEVSRAVVAELKEAGYLTPPDPGVT